MRPLEVVTLLVDAALVACIWASLRGGPRRPRVRWPAVLALVPAVAAVAQVLIEGYRWQMAPAYALAALGVVLAPVSLRRRAKGSTVGPACGRWPSVAAVAAVSLLLAAAAALPTLSPVPGLPEPSGPYEVGTVSRAWIDHDRPEPLTADPADRRELAVQAWYPAEVRPGTDAGPYVENGGEAGAVLAEEFGLPPFSLLHLGLVETHSTVGASVSGAEGSWPVLVFSPGLGGPRWLYTALAEDLASRGYVVVAMDHTYEAAVTVFPGGRAVPATKWPEDAEAAERYRARLLSIRVADARFVLDGLEEAGLAREGGPLSSGLDLERVGVFGHSMGGATAVEVLRQDRRFAAGANIDGGLGGEAFGAGFEQPYLLVEGERPSRGVGYTEEYKDRRDALFHTLGGGGEKAKVPDAYHGDFTDGCLYSPALRWLGYGCGPADPEHLLEVAADRVDAFFERRLAGAGG